MDKSNSKQSKPRAVPVLKLQQNAKLLLKLDHLHQEINSSHLLLSNSRTASGLSACCICSGFPALGLLIHKQHVAYWGNRAKLLFYSISPFTFATLLIQLSLLAYKRPISIFCQFLLLLHTCGPVFPRGMSFSAPLHHQLLPPSLPSLSHIMAFLLSFSSLFLAPLAVQSLF